MPTEVERKEFIVCKGMPSEKQKVISDNFLFVCRNRIERESKTRFSTNRELEIQYSARLLFYSRVPNVSLNLP